MMKTTIFIIVISVAQAFAANSYSQTARFSLNLNNVTTKTALQQIEDQSQFYFIYDATVVDVEKKISIKSDNETIENILDQLFRGTDIVCKINNRQIALTIQSSQTTNGQQLLSKVTGKVTDSSGSPLPGASVVIKGTTTGAITDADGNYSLSNVPSKATLTVSFIGMRAQEIAVNGMSVVDVKMYEETVGVDEIVVVGYGTQKKANLTGAVSSVQGKTLTQRSVASLSSALEGVMPGVSITQTSGQPGADGGTIKIRGIGSINSTTTPLVLVDGIEMDIDQIDMNTVESISVLKDAASASIYGSRASNGVILITTKRGKEGVLNINYNGTTTVQAPTNLPDPVPAWQYLQSELDAWDNADISITDEARAAQEQLIEEQKTLKPDNWTRYDTDWKNATLKDYSLMENHNVSVSGGTDKLKYYSAGSYLYQNGLIATNNFQRTTLRINADAKITKWAVLGLESNLRQSNTLTPGLSTPKAIINTALYMLPTLSAVKELDGKWGYGKNGLNPVAEAEDSGFDRTKSSEVLVNGTLTLTPIKNLSVIGQYSLRKVSARERAYTKPYEVSLSGVDLGEYPSEDNLTESLGETKRNYYRLQTSYEREIGQHKLNVLLGVQAEDNSYTYISASETGFDLERYYLSNGDGSTASVSGSASSWSMLSYFGRLNYNFNEKYLLELNGRYDGSSRFTEDNRWGFFPSASAGWLISNENFMGNTQAYLDLLKLRVSYGLLGNQNIGNYPYTATVNTGYSYWFNKELSTGVAQTTLANSDISWEKSKQFDVGIDATLWKGLLSITGDYYQKNVYDMLMKFALAYYAGMDPAYTNAGDMKNRGWEILLSHKNKIGDVSYDVAFSLSNNHNEVTNLNGNTYSDNSITVGYPYNGLWGYIAEGYFQSEEEVASSPTLSSSAIPGFIKYKDVDEDENLDSDDKVYLGDRYPHYEYGVKMNASWKNFDIQVFVQGVAKRNVYMSGIGLKPFANGSNLFKHQLDSWTTDNPNAAYPILVPEANAADNYVLSSKWVRNGAYARLKNVVVGYSLPKYVCEKINIGSCRIYLSGQNLLTFSHFYKGYDPEVSYGGTNGGEFYPIMQTYTLGLDLKF